MSANPFTSRRVVVGVGGGIAAYKVAYLVRLLIGAGADVQVVMSRAATEFVGPTTFAALSQRPVFDDLWSLGQEADIGHISVADAAELIIVAPATANLIARISAGRASDALSAVLLATQAPVLLAPSMNVNMWTHPSTRINLERLMSRQPTISTVGPDAGFLACQWDGVGRLAEPNEIFEAAARLLTRSDLAGRNVVVTAGPTREALDPVRFLSNRSSGKMGYAVALAAARRGAHVHLISGPVALSPPAGVRLESVTSASEMHERTIAAATSENVDVIVMVAAVGDYRPAITRVDKLKKDSWGEKPIIELTANVDILADLGQRRQRSKSKTPLLVGFAAETRNLVANAEAKLDRKGVDMIVANDVGAADGGFSVETNRVILVEPGRQTPLAPTPPDPVRWWTDQSPDIRETRRHHQQSGHQPGQPQLQRRRTKHHQARNHRHC